MERMDSRARAIASAAVLGFGLVVLALAIRVFIDSSGFGYDYVAYDAAARRIISGEPLYLADTAVRYATGAYAGLYLYPPPVAIMLAPLTALSTSDATLTWMLFRVVALAGACAVMPVTWTIRMLTFAAACLSFPVLFDLNIGNVSIVVVALTAVAWRAAGTPLAALAHAALIAIRFPFGLYFVQWLAQRQWRSIVWTIIAGVALIVVSLPIVGLGTYQDYVTILRSLPDISTGPHNLSLKSTALMLGLPETIASLVNVVGYALGLLAVVYAARRRDPDVAFVVTAVATLLVTPFMHPHYLVMLLLPAALLMSRGHPWAFFLPLLGWLPDALLPLLGPASIGLLLALSARVPAPVPPPSTTSPQHAMAP